MVELTLLIRKQGDTTLCRRCYTIFMSADTTLQSIMRPATVISQVASLKEAIDRVNAEKLNELLVVDDDGMLVGEVSVTDLLGAVVPDDLNGDDVLAHFADEETFRESIKKSPQ